MKEETTIRFATAEDIPQIINLCHQHALFEKAEYDETGKHQKLQDDLFSNDPPLKCLVAEVSEDIVGYATYTKQYSTWDANFYLYMDCLFLNKQSRGFGIGELLVNRIKEEAKKLNCTIIQWQTPTFNTRAMKFYRRIGAYAKTKERFFLEL